MSWEHSPDYGTKTTWTGMIASAAVLIAAPVALLFACGPQADAQKGAAIVGVASVIDGDTIEIHGQRIRLQGYDTPESGKRCGAVNIYREAADTLHELTGGKTVTCTDTGQRNNGRIVATCTVGGVDFGEHLVTQGLARDWPQFSGGRYCAAEKAAHSAKIGLWGVSCSADLWSGRDYTDPKTGKECS